MYNLATNLERNAIFRPNNIALIFQDQKITYFELNQKVNAIADHLTQLNIKPNDKIALSCPNTPEFIISYYAIQKVGAIVVPLNIMLKGDEVAYHLKDSDAVALISHQGSDAMPIGQFSYDGFQKADFCEHFILIETTNDDHISSTTHSFNRWLETGRKTFDAVYRSADDSCVILYTSGTTGAAKGAELSQSNMLCNAQACQSLTNQKGTDVSIAILPLFHSFGQSLIMNTSILAGSALVLIPRFVPKTVLQQINEHKVTHLAAVPTMFIGLMTYVEKHPIDYLDEIAKNLQVAISGGASMPIQILKQFEEKLKVPVIEGYGLSESSPVAAFNHLEFERKPGSIGQPLPGITMKVVDKNGHEVPTGTEGELIMRGHNVMKGYYKKPQETAKTIIDGWLYTGDIVRFDDEGYIYVVDRLKELIISGGYNIYPREVEEVYMKHPSVHLVAVIGIDHPRFGEEVKAFIILKEGHSISEKELIKWSREHLADYKCPKHLDIVEALPMTATGKILKRMLKA
ncbi:long-chain-fatty-acid--CoA ligase [Aliivibrio wodanis]|uniref:AMP-binding enzyme, putative long chain fatty acid Co-A ligase, acetyl-CoA synthetase n=1 Tax=Aliivibrio wodanis TaxID=80852 RepID=A0A090IQ62_9GAMM|nr:AMP-binding enzyme, putative long chain fatty acid Co-A ligase, acetyl-CoA synthetase [Aliivibrio wodanis]VVV03017.1 Long-chain-fatty-acid--CoA ligase [Aliivibrio wodanis]